MKLSAINRLEPPVLRGGYDLVVAASGYETRARYVAEVLESNKCQLGHRIVLTFYEHDKDCARPENDRTFARLHYRPVICRGASAEEAEQAFLEGLGHVKRDGPIAVLVDVSSMTRAWYGGIVRTLLQKVGLPELTVHFAYTPALFVPPSESYPPNRVVAPVSGFVGNTLPDKPTALIIGLGYDRDRALGLRDYLDPQHTILFSANPATDPRFIQCVKDVNAELIDELSDIQHLTYPVGDPVSIFKMIESVSNGLRHDWRVVLCSLGPKTFGLCCFLVASLNRDLSIWRVGADQHEKPTDHLPGGGPIVFATTWRG